MSGTLALVPVECTDAEPLRQLMAEVIARSVTTDEPVHSEMVANVNGNLAWALAHADECVHLKALAGDRLCGVVLVKRFWNLCSLFVDPAYQRRGIGRTLVQEAARQCAGRSDKGALWLNAAPAAQPFYRHLGFSYRESAQPLPPGFRAMARPW